MRTPVRGNVRNVAAVDPPEENEDFDSLRCYDCNVNFTSQHYLLGHLLHHIKQPSVLLRRLQQAPIKLTFKSKSDNKFEIINSPTSSVGFQLSPEYLAEEGQISTETDNCDGNTEDSGTFSAENLEELNENLDIPEEVVEENGQGEITTNIIFSANYASHIAGESPPASEGSHSNITSPSLTNDNSINSDIPGAEPTPPPESPTEYPKIRIKTTGLLKEPLTITEITDDNPNAEYRPAEVIEISNHTDNNDHSNYWATPCLEDPLKLPDSDKDDSNLLSSFLNNNNDQAKAFGITTTDSEFISLDRLDDRNRNALQVYNPSTSAISTNPLDSLTGLPMQQLAEQVSRLQPSSSGMHQQNVLINIQQFPQAPPQPPHGYQHPPMYPPHPPHPGMSAQPPPMYQPYQYQPPNPMYYPPTPNYPPAPHMPPPPQMPPQPPNQQMPQQSMPPQQNMPPPQPPQYRQPMPPRPPAPRQFNQQPQRGPAPRQPMAPRQRAPMIRPRGGMAAGAIRGPRPRMPGPTQNMNGTQNGQQRIIKRTPEQIQSLQAKKKRMDVLVPDKNDDADCQVIAVQPKNTDGGLPQIQSVQGGTSDPTDNVMHLSDSITLSVRNPPPRVQSPKKSDAKVVANILATRGITVTATPKPKEKPSPSKDGAPAPSVAINLNSAVSIIPTAKNNNTPSNSKPASNSNDSRLPTVDLTDDNAPDHHRNAPPKGAPVSPQKTNPRGALPFRCDLCPAQYPTAAGLNKHRQSYHKTGSPCEIGIPLIDLKQPGIVQKLTGLGIYNFIPLPSSTPDGNFALPVVSVNAARNSAVCNLNALGASSILTLGPVRSLPKPQMNNVSAPKQ